MLDKEKVLTKILFIKQCLKRLFELSENEKDIFISEYTLVDSAKYNLIVAIEAMIDICNHIVSRENYEIPATSADSIKSVTKNGVLPVEYEKNFIAMVKFRNRLVHLYFETDDKEIYKILKNNLNDFNVFIKAILEKLSK